MGFKRVDLAEAIFTSLDNGPTLLAMVDRNPVHVNDMAIILDLARSGVKFTPEQFSRVFCRGRQYGKTQEAILCLVVGFFRRDLPKARFQFRPVDPPEERGIYAMAQADEDLRLHYWISDDGSDDGAMRQQMFDRLVVMLEKLERANLLIIEARSRYHVDIARV